MSEVTPFYTIPTPLNPSERNGMTPWDYYAAAALTGYLAAGNRVDDSMTHEAARCADAMIEERAKRTEAES